jgi:hypothetical protein
MLIATAMWVGAAQGALATSSVVECGQVVAYTAPDAGTATDGSLTLGKLTPWAIHADAAISGAVASTLPSFAGSGPSCFAMDLDDGGVITALDFASEGTLTGPVVVDSGLGGYVFDDRIYVPTFVTDAYPGLAAIFATSAAIGARPSATFHVDVSTGQFTGFDAHVGFCGPGRIATGGDGRIGAATIPTAVLDAGDLAILAAAHGAEVCADIHAVGSIGGSGLTIDTDVELTTIPNTSTEVQPARSRDLPPTQLVLSAVIGVLMLLLRLGLVRRTGPSSGRHRPIR